MKYRIFTVFLLLALPFAASGQPVQEQVGTGISESISIEQAYNQVKGELTRAEGKEIPSPLDLVFSNERVNVEVENTDITIGVIIEDGVVEEVRDGGVLDPTVTVTVTQTGIRELARGEITAEELLTGGHVSVEGEGFLNTLKYKTLLFFIRSGMTLI